MDVKSFIDKNTIYDPELVKILNFAAFVPDTHEFSTRLVHFPGANASWRWGTEGHTFFSMVFYSQEGQEVFRYHSVAVSTKDHFDIQFDDFFALHQTSFSGLLMIQLHHPKVIPADLYLSHVHKKSGSYVAYPPTPFSGDTIFVESHETELENTLFWPGVIENDHTQTHIMVINPFSVPFSYQISLYLSDGTRIQSKINKIRPMKVQDVSIREIFSEYEEQIRNAQGAVSLCIAAQYKVNAYVCFKNIRNGSYSTIDHLHRYALV
jgi:hypothetical protein